MTMDRQKGGTSEKNSEAVSHELTDDYLHVTVTGFVELSTITSYVTKYQDLWTESGCVLWDLRKVDPTGVTSQDILNIDHAFAEIMNLRRGGSTAILISKELDLVARIAIALSDDMDSPIRIRSFLKEKEAIAWLKES